MQQSIKRSSRRNYGRAMVTGSCDDCDNRNKGSGNNDKRAG